MLALLFCQILNENLYLANSGVIFVKLDFIVNLEQILQSYDNSVFGIVTSIHQRVNLKLSPSLLFLILPDNFCDFIKKLFKLKACDFNGSFFINVIQQFVALFLSLIWLVFGFGAGMSLWALGWFLGRVFYLFWLGIENIQHVGFAFLLFLEDQVYGVLYVEVTLR